MGQKSNNTKLKILYRWRDRLYERGQNDENINNLIRQLQAAIRDY